MSKPKTEKQIMNDYLAENNVIGCDTKIIAKSVSFAWYRLHGRFAEMKDVIVYEAKKENGKLSKIWRKIKNEFQ